MGLKNNLIALAVLLNGNKMNDIINSKNSIINNSIIYLKENYKVISFFIIIIFVLFALFQFYSFSKIKDIRLNSIVYFNAKNIESKNDFIEIMNELSLNKDFYSIISKLEIIKISLENKNIESAEKLYLDLLNDNKIQSVYKAAIASHASYNFINFIYEKSDLNIINKIKNFINYIDDNLITYKGIKMEIKYLLKVSEHDIKNISTKNDTETIEIYKSIMESDDISSSIKERVNKIHEFQIYK